MDLRVLEYFLTVADEGNISHAAQLLHVSQPTISRQLIELEEEIGKKLFVRTNKKVILTEDGILFRQSAKDIMSLYAKARTDRTEQGELAGDLYIMTAEIESFELVAERIREFHELHPKVLFHIHSGNAEEICAAIDKGTVDIGYIVQSVDTMKYEVFNPGVAESWGVLVRNSHRLASKEFITVEDLRGETLIVPENARLRNDIREWTGSKGHIGAAYTLLRNVMILTVISDWVTICLETEKYVTDRLVFIPFSPKRTSSASLIWRQAAVYRPVMREFLSFLEIQNMNSK